MRRAWIAAMAVALLAVPPAAAAHGGDRPDSSKKNRSQACKALRAQMGTELFRATYGTNHNKRNAHGKCVSRHKRPFRGLVAQAVRECKAQVEAKQSRHFKGDDRKSDDRRADRRAFRQCVRDRFRALLAERRAALRAAAQSCDAERSANAAAFREKYGRGKHKRHAFFRCVVQTFRASQAAQTSA